MNVDVYAESDQDGTFLPLVSGGSSRHNLGGVLHLFSGGGVVLLMLLMTIGMMLNIP